MKTALFACLAAGTLTLSATLPSASSTPEPDCASVRTGIFELDQKGFEGMQIVRNDTLQMEIWEEKDMQSTFKIEWTGDCSYILHSPKHYFMKQLMPAGPDAKDSVFVSIDKVNAKGYHYTGYASSTPDFVVDGWIRFAK